jgi:hypothetical protein
VPCPDIILWGTWFEDSRKTRIVAQDQVGDYWVSTVFLGIDHSFSPWGKRGPPILFETMIFLEENEGETQVRYATWDEAAAGHADIVARLKAL